LPTKALTHVAYHEAGHAVAAYLHHRRFSYVTIAPQGDSLGHMRHGHNYFSGFEPGIDSSPRTATRAQDEARICLAGAIAVGIHLGKNSKRAWAGTEGDISAAVRMVSSISGSTEEEEAHLNLLSVQTRGMLSLPWNWAGVEALASTLLEHKRLGYVRARQIIKDAIEHYDQRSTSV